MLVVGLTGGIASGKSTVSSLLASHHLPIIDADIIARRVVQPGTRAHRKIAAYFGDSILLPDGTLDRPKLGSIVFADEQKRKVLNGIVHPAVRWEMFWSVLKAWMSGEKAVILDVPLLIEGGLHHWVGIVVVVYCSRDLQLTRLTSRDKLTQTAAQDRLAAQLPLTSKVAHADYVIDNSGTVTELAQQVTDLVKRIHQNAGGWWWNWRLSWWIPPAGILAAILCLVRRRMGWKIKRRTGSVLKKDT